MCGIFGYVGSEIDLGPVVLAALKSLEYRGYDSWGIALAQPDGFAVERRTGKISGATVDMPRAQVGFGHTRWATHGGISVANAHPHLDASGRIAVIHNGIVENFRELKDDLVAKGHCFRSETDSEVIAHLIGREVAAGHDLLEAVAGTFAKLHGLNAIIAMDSVTKELVATKNVSPLVVGYGPTSTTIASDALALRPHAERILFLEDHHIVRLNAQEVEVFDRTTLHQIPAMFSPLDVREGDTGLNGYPDYMAKEMAEQPDVLDRIVARSEPAIKALAAEIERAKNVFFVGCGTASYAALTGSYLMGRIAKRQITFVSGSEFKYYEHFLGPDTLVVALSQSGETADIVEAMLAARARGSRLGALVNARQSTLDRMVDVRVHLNAGPEQCVLSTKAYTAKVAVLLLTAHALNGTYGDGVALVQRAAEGLRSMLTEEWVGRVRDVADRIHTAEHLFVIGRGLAYPTALEAALKIKEVSYIHAEGFAGGELKHGVIALIEDGTPCVVYASNDETHADILSGAMELRSRGGWIIGVSPTSDPVFDVHISVPDLGDAAPLVNALPAQMLGYFSAKLLGNDPDKPRNLAKSVTVK